MSLAIDIGTKYIHIVEGQYKNKKLHMHRRIEVLTPTESIVDGEIVDYTRLKMVLKDVLKDHVIKTKKVSLTIDGTRHIEREVVVPKVREKELYPLLEGQVMGMVGDEEQYITAYSHMEPYEVDKLKVQFEALPLGMIEDYKRLLEELGLKPVALQLHQNAMTNFVRTNMSLDGGPIIIADIGNRQLNLHLLKEGKRQFTQTIKINTDQCERTLLSVRRIYEENKDFFELEMSQAQFEEDIILDTTMRPYLHQIIQQIMSMMQYQLTIDQNTPVQEIYLCGGVSQLKGMATYLAEYIEIPVKNIEEAPQYCNAMGALVTKVNFFKRHRQVERENKTLSTRTVGRIIALGVLCIIITISVLVITVLKGNANYQINQIERFLSSQDIQDQLNMIKQKDEKLSAMQRYTRNLEDAAKNIQSMLPITHQLMEDLAKTIPADVTIQALHHKGGKMNWKCQSLSKASINQLIYTLRECPWIAQVDYSGYAKGEGGYHFQVELVLVPGGEQS